jgi:YHS domain-containing protein
MTKRFALWNILGWTCLGLAVLLVGCGGGETTPEEESSTTGSQPADEAAADAEAIATKLAAADALDGNVDQIVTRCASCALLMDGKKDHAVEYEGYTLYFCREGCKERFEKDMEGMLVALEIPEQSE